MLPLGHWLRPPRHVLTLFLGVTGSLLLAMGWLGWQLMAQDRALAAQRAQERLENAAEAAVVSLRRSLDDVSQQLDALSKEPSGAAAAELANQLSAAGDDAVLVLAGTGHLEAWPTGRLVYYPAALLARDSPGVIAAAFAAGEALEFQRRDFAGAVRVFDSLARSADPRIRAGALVRLARIWLQWRQPDRALGAYNQLAALGATLVEGLPAGLLAQYGRCLVLDEIGRREDLQREAAALTVALDRGAWRLTRAEYEFYRGQARRWLPPEVGPEPGAPPTAQEQMSAAVSAAWDAWDAERGSLTPASGSRLWRSDGVATLVVWRGNGGRVAALVAGRRVVEARIVKPCNSALVRFRARMVLADADAASLSPGQTSDGTRVVQRAAAETRLPWSMSIVDTDPGGELAAAAGRGRLVLAGLAALMLFVLGGSAFIVRAVNRELEVSRLQTEFVAAVSHEFRTPLTSIRQVSELLLEARVPEARRQEYYRMQQRDSERLQRLVESLLDFGRMESGAREYRFEPLDLTALVRAVAGEFSGEVAAAGYVIDTDLQSDGAIVSADREALGRAIWNLLDNAVKYSASHKTVWLKTVVRDGRAEISVRDRGVGISPEDATRIFDKFARGANAAIAGVKGTGLGLAMVKHIVTAHGGTAHVDSAPGEGSTFTITVPLCAAGVGKR